MKLRTAFTLVELLVVIAIVALLIGILLPALGKTRASSRQIKDSTQVRGIHQGMVLWAQSNSDSYPRPSAEDKLHHTVAQGRPKDLPRHILSMMIYSGYFNPEICVTQAEVNGDIKVYRKYEYSEPLGAEATDKKLALWDPAFRALPADAAIGPNQTTIDPAGFSYAFQTPFGGRRSKWSNTFNATEAILGNRGPCYTLNTPTSHFNLTVAASASPSYDIPQGVNSNTLLIHGGRNTWEGNVVYNDNHVNFEDRPDPETLPFSFANLPVGEKTRFDNLFSNENDVTRLIDGSNSTITSATGVHTNNLLRNWKGGTFNQADGSIATSLIFWLD